MGGGWWWARVARLARLRFRGSLLPPQRPRSGGSRGSFAPGHGPRVGASPPPVSELDRADAWLLRKAHETEGSTRDKTRVRLTRRRWGSSGLGQRATNAFLSWFRNGLLASGIGVISFMQSDMGREAAYGFFLLGGLCVVWGGASYAAGLAALRGPMQLSLAGAAAGVGAVLAASLLWACAVGLYMGQLELDVELVPDDDAAAPTEGPDEAGRPPPE
ncbi:transmembrane protein 160 isoform X1 [Mesocricetus auratus]|uniref:Transmembrane protein 160 isoform X1 n=1 Tax=Mesocricetus auratus TaxID=10036 RepID=A0ABM2WNU9_MESAU|nr:transmembrane protein 160 isoform X1 [Mesocricetus auratus]